MGSRTMTACPVCHRCPFAGGVCEDRVNRGRRFFLMGALALPVARKIELAAAPFVAAPPLVVPRYLVTHYRLFNSATTYWLAE